MENPRPEKVAVVEEVKDKFQTADAVIITEYRGLTVRDLQDLRTSLREAGGEYHVYKNTLVRRATASLDLELDEHLLGLEPRGDRAGRVLKCIVYVSHGAILRREHYRTGGRRQSAPAGVAPCAGALDHGRGSDGGRFGHQLRQAFSTLAQILQWRRDQLPSWQRQLQRRAVRATRFDQRGAKRRAN